MSSHAITRAASPGPTFTVLPPLSLYVHLPWCVRKCPYCDFNSYEARGPLADIEYVDAVLRDLRSELPNVQGRQVQTIFIGGGTPSLFSAAAIERLLSGIGADLTLARGAEITLEANPGAVDAARFAAFRAAGVNRLSIGIQSLRDDQLRTLGRVHDGDEARRAIELARTAGFANINLDFMYALPNDSVAGALADLEEAIELAPQHLSWYQLTLEPNTAFERRPPALPADDLVAEIESHGRALLAAAGFIRYEISAYSRAGHACAHNLNYWQFGDYLGVGAGAHGKITLPAIPAIERRAKTRNPRTYLETAGAAKACDSQRLAEPRAIAVEFLLNALRVLEGVPQEWFTERTGLLLEAIAAPRREAVERGWLVDEPARLRATPAGREVLNRLLELFV
ncbi:MAG: radical SAM family heme chaperone HemW [Gammaproteobacteria bacterium]